MYVPYTIPEAHQISLASLQISPSRFNLRYARDPQVLHEQAGTCDLAVEVSIARIPAEFRHMPQCLAV